VKEPPVRVIDLNRRITPAIRRTRTAAAGEVEIAKPLTVPAESPKAFGRPFSELEPAQQRVLVRRWLEAETSAQTPDLTGKSDAL
jgi:hypothetical protein